MSDWQYVSLALLALTCMAAIMATVPSYILAAMVEAHAAEPQKAAVYRDHAKHFFRMSCFMSALTTLALINIIVSVIY